MKKSSFYFLAITLLVLTAIFLIVGQKSDRNKMSGLQKHSDSARLVSLLAKDRLIRDSSVTISQDQAGWPCFHGINRDNKSTETGLLKSWPDGGPELLWSASGLGEGYSSVAVAGGLIYTAGIVGNQTYVFAFDLNGKPVWKKPNGPAWKVEVSWASSYNGPRSTPTYDNGIVYHLSEAGRLTAYRSGTGDAIWSKDMVKDFGAVMTDYGFSESVLIDGNNLYVRPAGTKGFQVCLNKLTGEVIWANNEIPGAYAYNSSIIHESGGYRQLISASSNCYYGVDTKTGTLLWKVPLENTHELNCTDAVSFKEYILLSTTGEGCLLVKLSPSGKGINPEIVWHTDLMDNYHGGIVFHDGYFYGSGDRNHGWFSIDLLTGKPMWKAQGAGSLTYADGRLYLYNDNGIMRLVKASPEKYEITGEFRVPRGGSGPYWAHPVVCGGRLYLRHTDQLFVYNISRI